MVRCRSEEVLNQRLPAEQCTFPPAMGMPTSPILGVFPHRLHGPIPCVRRDLSVIFPDQGAESDVFVGSPRPDRRTRLELRSQRQLPLGHGRIAP
jgi:hypothetical protein